MRHPYEILRPEYEADLRRVAIRDDRRGAVSATIDRLLRHFDAGDYNAVSEKTAIPLAFIAPSFEREASSDFRKSPAQGDRWDRKSIHVPAGRGPFSSWSEAASDAYHLDGLDKVGEGNWDGALICFYGETFNGFGYRDYHGIRSPYLWGGTNLQQPGKYTSDGHYDASVMDGQLGIIPMAMELIRRRPQFAVPGLFAFRTDAAANAPSSKVATSGIGGVKKGHDVFWLQAGLNKVLGSELDEPLLVDGNYGHKTRAAVFQFQRKVGNIKVDGWFGPETEDALVAALGDIKPNP